MTLRIPAMVDPHVHLRDLEWSHKATFASETAAAVAGGYWCVLDMPNTPPATVDAVSLAVKQKAFEKQAFCDWGVYFGASQSNVVDDYAKVTAEVCGLKIYNNETTGTLLIEDQSLRDAHYRVWTAASQKPIAVHAEEETVADILKLARKYRAFTHFCHISTRYEIDLLRAAKEEGLPISVGVTPHHLYLTEADLPVLGSLGMMKPPLKTADDRDALWEAIADGTVDIVESDHAPHTLAEKQSAKPPYGVPGLETTLPLMCLAVEEGRISYERMIELLALNAQRIFNLHPDSETYTLVDTDAHYTIDRASLRTKCGWSPFEGMRVPGRVIGVWIRGVQVYDGENILVAQGFGHDAASRQVIA